MRKKRDREYIVEVEVTRKEQWLIKATDEQAAKDLADQGDCDAVAAVGELKDWAVLGARLNR